MKKYILVACLSLLLPSLANAAVLDAMTAHINFVGQHHLNPGNYGVWIVHSLTLDGVSPPDKRVQNRVMAVQLPVSITGDVEIPRIDFGEEQYMKHIPAFKGHMGPEIVSNPSKEYWKKENKHFQIFVVPFPRDNDEIPAPHPEDITTIVKAFTDDSCCKPEGLGVFATLRFQIDGEGCDENPECGVNYLHDSLEDLRFWRLDFDFEPDEELRATCQQLHANKYEADLNIASSSKKYRYRSWRRFEPIYLLTRGSETALQVRSEVDFSVPDEMAMTASDKLDLADDFKARQYIFRDIISLTAGVIEGKALHVFAPELTVRPEDLEEEYIIIPLSL